MRWQNFNKMKIIKTILILVFLLLPVFVSAQKTNDPKMDQWFYEDLNIYEAWGYTTGSPDVVVAVIDNGFDTFHPDLRANVWKNNNEIANNKKDDDNNGYIDDVWGWNFLDDNNDPRPNIKNITIEEREEGVYNHGTLVAGLIGAVGNNNLDFVGVNWQVKLMNLKTLGNSGSGSFAGFSSAIYYAVDNGADVINVSMVGDMETDDIVKAIKYAYDSGVVVVAAVGNNGLDLDVDPLYPVCMDANEDLQMVLGVSAIKQDHRLTLFSNIGSSCVDVTAPGQDMSSLLRFSPANKLTERYGENKNGTSFAAPLVSGVAALIKSVQPSWGPVEIFKAITSTVHHTPGQDEDIYSKLFGAGLLQIDKAILYAVGELKASNKIESILSLEYSSGKAETRDIKNKEDKKRLVGSLEGIVDLEKYEKGLIKFVGVSESFEGNSEVKFYDKNWKVQSSWLVHSSGNLDLAVGDVNNDKKNEIILSPKYEDDQVYRVYDVEGEELSEYSISGEHRGVSVSILKNKIVAAYNFEGLKIRKFVNNKIDEEIEVNSLEAVGNLAVGDIDGDGKMEYVLTSVSGDIPYLVYYEQDGKLKRKFTAYDSGFRGGLSIGVGDFDGDSKDDVIVAPLVGTQPVRVWSGKVRKLDQWQPYAGSTKGIKLLVY